MKEDIANIKMLLALMLKREGVLGGLNDPDRLLWSQTIKALGINPL